MRKGCIAAGVLCLFLLAFAMTGTEHYIQAQEIRQELAGKILRFHVRANSDGEEDQELKLKVRDAVGLLMSEKLEGVTDLEQCRRITRKNLGKIVETARGVIRENGCDYPVEAYIARVDFPDKTYGDYTFPAGNYEALEVIIGSGTGHNWWCVMYPNMCFSGSGYEVVEKRAQKSLERTLTQEEYELLMEKKNYKVTCRYLKFLNPCLEKLQEIW